MTIWQIRVLCIMLLCSVIAACGGGGGDNSPAVSGSSSSSSSTSVSAYTIGGTVSGLSGSVVLQNNAGDDLTVSVDGNFTFSTSVTNGTMYAATVLTQPALQTCTVTNGSGATANANVTNIAVSCVTNTYTIGGTASGLTGSVVLQNNAGDNLTVSVDGSFTFSSPINSGATYAVTVFTQPATQTCAVTNGSGSGNSDATNIAVSCVTNTYTISGVISGLTGSVVLQNNAGDDLTANANSNFVFSSSINSGITYAVTVLTQPALQTCTVTNGGGTANANVTNITVSCKNNPPTLSLSFQQIKTFHFSWTAFNGATSYKLMEDPTGSAGYTQVGGDMSANTTSYDEVVPLYRRVNARYIVSACVDSACIDSNVVNVSGSLVAAVGYFKASNTDANDRFGYSVAFSADGNTLAVAAYEESSNANGIDGDQTNNVDGGSGAVYVFTRSGSSWAQQAYIKASNTGAGDLFGNSIALSADGNTLAVGAASEASNATGIGGDQTNNADGYAGAAYVFTRSGSSWAQQAYIKASNTGANDEFGYSVALSADGNTLATAAPIEASNATGINGDQTNNADLAAGAVYVFTRSGSSWTQQAYIKASNTYGGDQFGYSVALSADGNTLAVGARNESSNATDIGGDQTNHADTGAGAVYVFTRSGSSWAQQTYIKASNTNAFDYFGISVSLSTDGNTLAVGAIYETSNATGIDGDQTNNADNGAGAVYVFTRSGSSWAQQAYIKASNTNVGEEFGYSVALSADGNTLAVGAIGEASNATGINGDQTNNAGNGAGAVYVFTRSGSSWTQQAYVKASNSSVGDQFGVSVSLSTDGNTLAVGAASEASNATGIGGDQTNNADSTAGAVYLY